MSSPFIKYDCTHVKRFNAKNIFMAGIKAFLLKRTSDIRKIRNNTPDICPVIRHIR